MIEKEDKNENNKFRLKTNPMMWTEKYTSFKFFDLLSDEKTNRNVLTWLKSWDEVVFPENPLVNLKIPESL